MYNGTLKLAWGANADADLAGYKIYTGNISHVYSQTMTTTSLLATVSGLNIGQIWYNAITAYDSAGNESTFSAEVSKVVTGSVLQLLRRVV